MLWLMNTEETLKKLEESLWRPESRFDKEYMENILADFFVEFGRSGQVYSREEFITAVKQELRAELPLTNLRMKQISEDIVLLTYVSKVMYEKLEIASRSSLWTKTSSDWKLSFHQGTPTDSPIQ